MVDPMCGLSLRCGGEGAHDSDKVVFAGKIELHGNQHILSGINGIIEPPGEITGPGIIMENMNRGVADLFHPLGGKDPLRTALAEFNQFQGKQLTIIRP